VREDAKPTDKSARNGDFQPRAAADLQAWIWWSHSLDDCQSICVDGQLNCTADTGMTVAMRKKTKTRHVTLYKW